MRKQRQQQSVSRLRARTSNHPPTLIRQLSPSHCGQVCDQPHPGVVLEILKSCVEGDCAKANRRMKALYDTGYSSNDIIGTVFRVRVSGLALVRVMLNLAPECCCCYCCLVVVLRVVLDLRVWLDGSNAFVFGRDSGQVCGSISRELQAVSRLR